MSFSYLACDIPISTVSPGVYNNVSVAKCVRVLGGLGVGALFCKYLWAILSERHLIILDEEGKGPITRWTDKGDQEDPLSPLLFNIVTYQVSRGDFVL